MRLWLEHGLEMYLAEFKVNALLLASGEATLLVGEPPWACRTDNQARILFLSRIIIVINCQYSVDYYRHKLLV